MNFTDATDEGSDPPLQSSFDESSAWYWYRYPVVLIIAHDGMESMR